MTSYGFWYPDTVIDVYRKMSLEVYQQKVPILSMLFSPGFMFWWMIVPLLLIEV